MQVNAALVIRGLAGTFAPLPQRQLGPLTGGRENRNAQTTIMLTSC